jgi:hypothetical protein
MTVEYFNSFGGYSVGIPPVPVVDTAGNVISNFNNLSGNVSANKVYANTYFFANGQPLAIGAAGSNTQLQYNNQGSFAGIPNVTWNGSILNLGAAEAVSILGGLNGYYLQTDGAGGLTWAPGGNGGGGGNGSPGGANMQIQFNDEGNFGGYAGFTFDKDTGTLNAPGNINGENISVVDANITGNILAANIDATGNITATYFIGNGSQLTGIQVDTANYVIQHAQPNITSVGTLTALQVSGVTSLGAVANVHITGGLTGYVLTTDGTGNLSWEAAGSGGGSPGGANTQIQFNDSGNFNGSAAFTFNKVSNAVIMTGNLTTKNITSNSITAYGNIVASGNITADHLFGNGIYITDVQTNTANFVIRASQPNITSVGTLVNLAVSGNIISAQYVSAANIQTSGNANVGTLRVSGAATVNGQFTGNGIIALGTSPNVTLGAVSNVHISGGLNGYVLSTDGLGTLSWQPPGGSGGNGTPGGSNTQVQYNAAGNFEGSPYFTFDENSHTVQVSGNFIANAMQLGSGAYKFCSSYVYFATTTSTSHQVIYSIPVSECSGIEFEIIGTDSAGQKRQFVKISSLYYAGVVQYNEYSGLYINGGVGTFEVLYNPGTVIQPPSVDLAVTPDSSNNIVYKMWISVLAP